MFIHLFLFISTIYAASSVTKFDMQTWVLRSLDQYRSFLSEPRSDQLSCVEDPITYLLLETYLQAAKNAVYEVEVDRPRTWNSVVRILDAQGELNNSKFLLPTFILKENLYRIFKSFDDRLNIHELNELSVAKTSKILSEICGFKVILDDLSFVPATLFIVLCEKNHYYENQISSNSEFKSDIRVPASLPLIPPSGAKQNFIDGHIANSESTKGQVELEALDVNPQINSAYMKNVMANSVSQYKAFMNSSEARSKVSSDPITKELVLEYNQKKIASKAKIPSNHSIWNQVLLTLIPKKQINYGYPITDAKFRSYNFLIKCLKGIMSICGYNLEYSPKKQKDMYSHIGKFFNEFANVKIYFDDNNFSPIIFYIILTCKAYAPSADLLTINMSESHRVVQDQTIDPLVEKESIEQLASTNLKTLPKFTSSANTREDISDCQTEDHKLKPSITLKRKRLNVSPMLSKEAHNDSNVIKQNVLAPLSKRSNNQVSKNPNAPPISLSSLSKRINAQDLVRPSTLPPCYSMNLINPITSDQQQHYYINCLQEMEPNKSCMEAELIDEEESHYHNYLDDSFEEEQVGHETHSPRHSDFNSYSLNDYFK